MTNKSYFYHDKPVFGLDIGFSSMKVMQVEPLGKKHVITGYGVANFDAGAIVDGIIKDPIALAKAAHELFNKQLVGDITTRRVAMAIPASRTFTRTMTLPKLHEKDIAEAVKLEAEQYIPMPIDDLHLDYNVIHTTPEEIELLAVAVPKKVVDSYLAFARLVDLEPIAIETTITAGSRLFAKTEGSDLPTVLIDFGSLSTDITVYDNAIIVTGTVPGGGDSFTASIAEILNISKQEAHIVKTKYGLGLSKKQKEITAATKPILDQLGKEIRRMIRYYEERYGTERKIGQIVTIGGGANMPGISEYMTSLLRIPVRMSNPWEYISFGKLQPPNSIEKSMYITVAGLSLTEAKKVFT